jgi:hypothetical protein
MAEKDIVQNMISQLGQSQDERMSDALRTDFVEVDERTTDDLLRFAKDFAALVNYYRNDITTPAGDWTKFFSYQTDAKTLASLRQGSGAHTPAHLALLLSFLELYREPQARLNRFTGRHLDFYYREVLRLGKRPAVPDKAHVLIELKKQSRPIVISSGNVLSAGKDKSGTELIYAPTNESVINVATVASLRSMFLDTNGHGAVHYAPIANSSDGVGGTLPEANPMWRGFGYLNLPFAEVGFALASPVLRMKEGLRRITVKLTLSNVDPAKLNVTALTGAFQAFVTGEKSWQGPYPISPTLSGGVMQFDFIIPEIEKAVVDYDAVIHGYSYASRAPVVQMHLKADSALIGYNDLDGVTVQSVQVSVDVSSVTQLNLESDGGTLDPKKPFMPFGPEAGKDSDFLVGCDEMLSKKLSEVAINLHWKDAPTDFGSYYNIKAYGVTGVSNGYFTARASFRDSGGWEYAHSVPLFDSTDASLAHTITIKPPRSPDFVGFYGIPIGTNVSALRGSSSGWAAITAEKLVRRYPIFDTLEPAPPEPRSEFITLMLEKDFLHSTYRKKYIECVLAANNTPDFGWLGRPNPYTSGTHDLALLNEPYTPVVQSISLSYKAHSDDVKVSSPELADFSNLDVQFFQLAYFGQMHEHGYQRNQFSFLADKSVSLLPVYENEGELLIGLANLNPQDSVSLLFEVAEGSANPDLPQDLIVWSVLCDNYWKALGSDRVVLDTTNQLRVSGVIKFVIPAEATIHNTILPANHIWLRAGVAKNAAAMSQLIAVTANAVEVQFQGHGNDPAHLISALNAGTIAKLKSGLAAVKTVKQPYASFGGASEESDNDFYRRVSERLRHKDRCITPWDYERIILQAFPRVHKVKCIPHAREGGWLAPGCVLIIVVPDLRNKNAMDPLEPKVDADTISRIAEFVQRRAGMQVQVKVKNPRYQRIRLDFKVKFRVGYEFNQYSEQLKKELIGFLSPWVADSERDISFGGKIYKSVLLDFVEKLAPVDYVTDFRMDSFMEGPVKVDVNEAGPESPDAILVSDYTHIVKAAA